MHKSLQGAHYPLFREYNLNDVGIAIMASGTFLNSEVLNSLGWVGASYRRGCTEYRSRAAKGLDSPSGRSQHITE